MQVFWLIDGRTRAQLIKLQYKLYGTKLDIASQKPPWEFPAPIPEIPVRADMSKEELGNFISKPPEHQEKVG